MVIKRLLRYFIPSLASLTLILAALILFLILSIMTSLIAATINRKAVGGRLKAEGVNRISETSSSNIVVRIFSALSFLGKVNAL